MAASLLVAGFEMLGGTTNPEYRLAPGFDFGAGELEQTVISSLYLDGDTVSGERTRNRTVTLPITVRGSNPQTVAANVSTLLQAISVPTFTMQWTPDGGLPLIFDCYRAAWSRPERSLVKDAQGLTSILLTFQASPFGRSPDVQSVTAGGTLQIDSFDSPPTGTTLNTSNKYEGTASGQIAYTYSTLTRSSSGANVNRTFAAKNLSTYSNVSLRLYTPVSHTLNLFLNLSSSGGATSYPVASTVLPSAKWGVIYVPLTGGTVTSGTGVDLTAVTGYSFGTIVLADIHSSYVLADDMRASGTAATIIGPTSHASVLSVPVSVGSARTPINLALSNGSTLAAFLLHSPPEDQDPAAAILSSLSNASTNQTVTIAALNGNLDGTYTVALGVDVVGGGSVTATVTITQQQSGSNVGAAKVLTKTYTSGSHIVPVGQVTLPLYDVPGDNNTTGYTVQVQITGADRYTEVMFLDSRGQTVYSDIDLTTAAANVYVDEPGPLQSAPSVYAGASRTVAVGALGNCVLTGGPVVFEPGVSKVLAWVSTSTPAVSATFYPRWVDERVS